MARLEVIARRHRLRRYLVDLLRLHPDQRLIVAVPISHPLNRLVQVVGPPVRVDVNQLHREVRVLCVRRHIERHLYGAAHFDSLLQRFGAVYQNVGAFGARQRRWGWSPPLSAGPPPPPPPASREQKTSPP